MATNLFFAAEAIAEGVSEMKLEDMALDLPIHTITFYTMSYVSFGIAGILMVDQYFGRRIHCFDNPAFKQPPMVIAEYCWEHGHFFRNDTASYYVPPVSAEVLLSTYVYFFIKGFIFVLPHVLWNLQYKPFLAAMVRESMILLSEIERMWLRFSETVNDVYLEMRGKAKSSAKVKQAQAVCLEVTRDAVNISIRMNENYKSVSGFFQFRLVWDMLMLPAFVLCDIALFLANNRYMATDFYCPIPESTETMRCVVPVLQFQWKALVLALICGGFALLANIYQSFWLGWVLLNPNTDSCLLERIPFARKVATLSWPKLRSRQAYKLLSIYLLQNVAILKSVLFLESFVNHLKAQNFISDETAVRLSDNVEMVPIAEAEDIASEEEPIWSFAKHKGKAKKV